MLTFKRTFILLLLAVASAATTITVIEEQTPAVVDESPAVKEEVPIVTEEVPAAVKEDEAAKAAIEEVPPPVVEETPEVKEEAPVVTEETPAEKLDTPPEKQDATTTTTSYGVDCSFPIHHLNFRDANTCGDLLGDRVGLYEEFMKGCRAKFGFRCDQTEDERIDQSLRQPRSLLNYTSTGFRKIRAPEALFALIEDHWWRNFDEKEEDFVEEWTKGQTYVNYWNRNTTYYGLAEETAGGSDDLANEIYDKARPVIEEWTGMELQPASLYGIRVYREGAILSPHVDRNPLILSAIVNVAQDPDMETDWPLEVYDRNGNAVNVSMVPGDMVLYESGTLMHARPFPLKGKYYANVFVHFEPTGRRLEDIGDEEMVYNSPKNPANFEENILLPPYIIPGSPEAKYYIEYNPHGWGEEVEEEEEDPWADWDSDDEEPEEEEEEEGDEWNGDEDEEEEWNGEEEQDQREEEEENWDDDDDDDDDDMEGEEEWDEEEDMEGEEEWDEEEDMEDDMDMGEDEWEDDWDEESGEENNEELDDEWDEDAEDTEGEEEVHSQEEEPTAPDSAPKQEQPPSCPSNLDVTLAPAECRNKMTLPVQKQIVS